VFPVADGHIIIATGNDNQYQKLCGMLGAPELARKAEYLNNTGRLAHRDELVEQLSTLTKRMKSVELLDKLEAVGVPAGPINDLDQVFADPQVIHRGMRLELASDAAKDGKIPGVRTPIMIGGKPVASPRPRRVSASTPPRSCAKSERREASRSGRDTKPCVPI